MIPDSSLTSMQPNTQIRAQLFVSIWLYIKSVNIFGFYRNGEIFVSCIKAEWMIITMEHFWGLIVLRAIQKTTLFLVCIQCLCDDINLSTRNWIYLHLSVNLSTFICEFIYIYLWIYLHLSEFIYIYLNLSTFICEFIYIYLN